MCTDGEDKDMATKEITSKRIEKSIMNSLEEIKLIQEGKKQKESMSDMIKQLRKELEQE